MTFNVEKNKKDFPILDRKIYSHRLVYLDNAATSQKPLSVINAVSDYYKTTNANVHRGIHVLSEEATELYESARKVIATFLGSRDEKEIIFNKGATDGLNMLAHILSVDLKKGDEIVTTDFEHHSSFIPWLMAAKRTGAKLVVLASNENGEIPPDEFSKALNAKTKIVAITHASNVLGTILPVREIAKMAHKFGALVVVDGAQAAPHLKINVESLGCDFYCLSGHKMLGPTGIGVLWGRRDLLEKLQPFEYGGGMIGDVSYTDASWAELPDKFEAGTPHVAGAVGFTEACKYLTDVGMDTVRKHELELLKYAMERLREIDGLTLLGPKEPEKRTGLISFTVKGIHSHDLASVLSAVGVAVRSGHHCTMPYHKKHGIAASTRASFYLYNDKEDVDALIDGIKEAVKTLT